MTVTNIETKTRSKMSNGERLICPILFLAGLKLILQQPFFAEFFSTEVPFCSSLMVSRLLHIFYQF